MSKMTKTEGARKYIEKGNCIGTKCENCFTTHGECKDLSHIEIVELAKAYEKRYARPKVKKPVKDKAVSEMTPLDIAKAIRDNDYKFDCKYEETGCGDCAASGFCIERGICHKEAVDIYIAGHNDHIPDTTKKVEYVRCVDAGAFPLTKGKIYEVLEEFEDIYTLVDDDGVRCRYPYSRFEPAEKPVVKENFTPEPLTVEQIYKAFINKEKIYDVSDDYLNEINFAKYDYLKIARYSITAGSEGGVCLLVTDVSKCYKTHSEAYKIFASRR